MTHIFVSHASEDKSSLIRPIVEVLVAEGEPVWIDRPGVGTGNFGFAQTYISKNDIDYLQSGNSWSVNIQSALRQSGAVLGCLSSALLGQRDVIIGELTVASTMGKLVTCIVDDLNYEDLPELTLGLLDLGRVQAPQLDPDRLRRALEFRKQENCAVEDLPVELSTEWERVRNLIASVNQVRSEPRRMRARDIERLTPVLSRIPIGPVLKIDRIPTELIYTFGDYLSEPDRVRALIRQANELVVAATEDKELASKLVIRPGALPPVGSTSGDNFWTQVFQRAGLVSRRTVAALAINPVATWAYEQSAIQNVVDTFLDELKERVHR